MRWPLHANLHTRHSATRYVELPGSSGLGKLRVDRRSSPSGHGCSRSNSAINQIRSRDELPCYGSLEPTSGGNSKQRGYTPGKANNDPTVHHGAPRAARKQAGGVTMSRSSDRPAADMIGIHAPMQTDHWKRQRGACRCGLTREGACKQRRWQKCQTPCPSSPAMRE